MDTCRDLLTWMLRESGAIASGQVPKAQDINDAFKRVNVMLAQWQRKRWMVYHLVDVVCEATGLSDYSVGPGQQFNIGNRPERIYSGFFRQYFPNPPPPGPNQEYTYQCIVRDHYNTSVVSNMVPLVLVGPSPPTPNPETFGPVDYPLHIIDSYEDYSGIALKKLPSWPQSVFLDTGWPYATAKFYPVPLQGQFELHLQFAAVLQSFINLSDPIMLPPEYEAGLLYNGIVRTRAAYGLQADPAFIAMAKDGLETIRDANLQIPNLKMPAALISPGRYNIFSDNIDR